MGKGSKKSKHKAKARVKAAQEVRSPLTKEDRREKQAISELTKATARFQAAQTNRLNRTHWERSHGQSINNDIATYLPTLMARCAFEYASNPLFEGVVNTFKDDIVGRDGPLLQVNTPDKAFNEAVESAWRSVFLDPDPSHRFGGVEVMKSWVGSLLLAGSYVNINATVRRPSTKVTFGWRSIHPRRLVTPPEQVGDPNVAFGCRSDADGAPIEYYVDVTKANGPFQSFGIDFATYPAEAVQHCYIPVEPEQLTGYPMMTSTLETAADLRDYDKLVMEAAKNAAGHAVGLQAIHPEMVTDPEPIATDTLPMSPGEVNVAPPGWSWQSLTSTQPAAEYVSYRHERGAELGRPIHMPLLVVFLTAADANFSSAQYEGTVYVDGCQSIQGFVERRSLSPFVMSMVTEMAIRGLVRIPAGFNEFSLAWTHNVPAHANIEKFVSAIRMMIEDGIISQEMASAMLGFDWEKVVASRKRCADDLEANDLPAAPYNVGNAKVPGEQPQDVPAVPAKKPTSKPANKTVKRRKRNGRLSLTT